MDADGRIVGAEEAVRDNLHRLQPGDPRLLQILQLRSRQLQRNDGGAAIFLARPLLLFLYDSKYSSGLSVFIIYLFCDIIRFSNSSVILTAFGKTSMIMYASISMLVLNLFANFLFYKIFGFWGLAFCTLILSVSFCVFLLIHGAHLLEISAMNLFDLGEVALFVAGILVSGGCDLFRSNLPRTPPGYLSEYDCSFLCFCSVQFFGKQENNISITQTN